MCRGVRVWRDRSLRGRMAMYTRSHRGAGPPGWTGPRQGGREPAMVVRGVGVRVVEPQGVARVGNHQAAGVGVRAAVGVWVLGDLSDAGDGGGGDELLPRKGRGPRARERPRHHCCQVQSRRPRVASCDMRFFMGGLHQHHAMSRQGRPEPTMVVRGLGVFLKRAFMGRGSRAVAVCLVGHARVVQSLEVVGRQG